MNKKAASILLVQKMKKKKKEKYFIHDEPAAITEIIIPNLSIKRLLLKLYINYFHDVAHYLVIQYSTVQSVLMDGIACACSFMQ
jgi:hypothetical protein